MLFEQHVAGLLAELGIADEQRHDDYHLAIAGGLAAWLVAGLGIFLAPLRP
jgi:hypothetical protein